MALRPRLASIAISDSRRLNAAYSEGRYAICNAMTTKPDAAAQIKTVSLVRCAERAKPSVNIAAPTCFTASPRSWVYGLEHRRRTPRRAAPTTRRVAQ